MGESFSSTIKSELARLARFGANITDSHSCCIFLPIELVIGQTSASTAVGIGDSLELVSAHSLSTDLIVGAKLPKASGIVGWVSTHRRSIHVAPFELESSALGIYRESHDLKSFIGVPVQITLGPSASQQFTGVITCDSKKSFAFSKLQGKLLEELSLEVASIVQLAAKAFTSPETASSNWSQFLPTAEALSASLGLGSVDVVRVKILNMSDVEAIRGTAQSIEVHQQLIRLIRQSISPQFPIAALPNGDVILMCDNMMTGFCETRIRSLALHLGTPRSPVVLDVTRSRPAARRDRNAVTIDQLVSSSIRPVEEKEGVTRERRLG